MTLDAGQRFGVYEILAPLGAGGMGEVYRARDTRLGREVAIKVLPEALSADRERLGRFEQEARAASALNHPNIVTIHDVGFEGDRPYLAMELVDGKSLRELVVSGALPIRRVLAIGTQIAEGLAKAHAAGIVHRDLKPENVMVSKDGFVKILDFGLAKLAEPQSGEVSAMPTLVKPETRPGVVLGTVGYMSPEQASGEVLDYRSDQFSLGTMLYEMSTGEKAFQRKTAAETMSAIIREEPEPVGKLRPEIPAPLRWILERCLSKDREERYTSTRDLARELAGVRDHISEISGGIEAQAALPARRRRRILLPIAALALLLTGLAAGRLLSRAPSAAAPPSFQRLTFKKIAIANARFAPDGKAVLYGTNTQGRELLHQVRIGSPESQTFDFGSADIFAVSSTGEMAVKLGRGPTGTLARAPILGGALRPVVEDVLWAGADWSPDGKELAVVRSIGGKGRLEFPLGKVLAEGIIGCPRISPQGTWIAFAEADRLTLIDSEGKQKKTLTHGSPTVECPMAWRPDGQEIWFGGAKPGEQPALYAVDLEGRLRLVARVPGALELFDISRDGRVLLANHAINRILRGAVGGASEEERDLAWLDRSMPAQLSSDGGLLLFTELGEGSPAGPSVYVRKTDGSPAVRLGEGTAMALSRDQKWVIARVGGEPSQLAILPTGTGETRRIPNDGFETLLGADWLADGRGIVFAAREKGAPPRVYVQSLEGGKPRPITPAGFSFRAGTRGTMANPVSPDGKLVYAGDRSGAGTLFPIAGGTPTPVPALVPGERPVQWSADSRGLQVQKLDDWSIRTLDLATGRREHPRTIRGGEFGPGVLVMTPDGRSYAVGYDEVSSALYAVDGLR